MSSLQHVSGHLTANSGQYALIHTHWNAYVVNSLVEGAKEALLSHGISEKQITVVQCPGAFEIPLVAKRLADLGKYHAIVALGAVIKGGTMHFEYVASEAVKGLSTVMLSHNIPVTFGILTVDSIEQAIERAGTKMGNKGAEAALAALEMVNLLENIKYLK